MEGTKGGRFLRKGQDDREKTVETGRRKQENPLKKCILRCDTRRNDQIFRRPTDRQTEGDGEASDQHNGFCGSGPFKPARGMLLLQHAMSKYV